MKIERISLWWVACMMVALVASGVVAQDDKDKAVEEMRILTLEHGIASETLDVVRSIAGRWMMLDMTADPRANRIIAYGTRGNLERLAEMVEQLDVPVENRQTRGSGDSIRTEILTVAHRPARELHEVAEMHLSNYGRIVVDTTRNALVLRDRAETIDKIRALVRELDVETGSLVMHFFVLSSGGESLDGIPDAARVKTELERLGLRDYGISGRAAVRCLETSQFETKSSFTSGEIFIGGRARLVSDRRAVEVTLNADIRLITNPGDGKPVQQSTSKLASTLKAPLDHLMVVGLTPSGEASSRPLVMVMRVARE